jgi:hypothetical protein
MYSDGERPVCNGCLDQDLAAVGKLDRIAGQIEQDLSETMLVATACRQVRRHLDLESELLLRRQWRHRGMDGVHDFAVSGHAAALPSPAMNSRRRISPRAQGR